MTVLSIERDKTKGEEPYCYCNRCRSYTYHVVLTSIDSTLGFGPSPVGFRHTQIIQCMGCREVTFRDLTKTWGEPENLRKRKTRKVDTEETLYPAPNTGRGRVEQYWDLPDDVRRIYLETHSAIVGNLPVLTGIGIRALLETVCKDRKATGRSLQAKIDSLQSVGLLTKDSADFLHGLRVMGNDAAHEVVPHGPEKLGIAMDIVEHLLISVYVIPKKAGELKKS